MKILPIVLPALLLAAPAFAQTDSPAGDFQLRLRDVVVAPSASANIQISGKSIGGSTKATTSDIPEADLSYFVDDNVSVEVIAGVTKHTVSNSVAGRVVSTELLPPTVTLQYQFDPNGAIRPYVGAGINYTFFFDNSSPLTGMKLTNNFGWALQAGADIPVGDGPYFLNVDLKKIFLSTTARAGAGTVFAPVRLDPWLFGVGAGIRF
jgi:outer membrane protein